MHLGHSKEKYMAGSYSISKEVLEIMCSSDWIYIVKEIFAIFSEREYKKWEYIKWKEKSKQFVLNEMGSIYFLVCLFH